MDGRREEPQLEVRKTAMTQPSRSLTGNAGSVTIRPERPGDFAAIRDLVCNAFGREIEADLVDKLRASDAYLPDLALVATRDRQILGHIMITGINIELDARAQLASVILAPLAVAPEHQRQGIGSALTRAALALAKAAGFGSMILVGHPTYYPRFGFRPASTWGIRFDEPIPDDVFVAIELVPDALANATGVVTLPPAFEGV